MLGYPFIEELNRGILTHSDAIQGRFYLCPLYGAELNNISLDDIISASLPETKRYPLAIMMPPRSSGDYGKKSGTWNNFKFAMYFLKSNGITTAGQMQALNKQTLTSKHTIVEDWHDMSRCAIHYARVLRSVVVDKGLQQHFIVSDRNPQTIDPVSTIGNDRVSGVLLQYSGAIALPCGTEDYPEDYLSRIVIETTDTHPQHKM